MRIIPRPPVVNERALPLLQITRLILGKS